MSENISEYTASITGLTCKPLSILSETISPQEMGTAWGGNGCDEEEKTNLEKIVTSVMGPTPDSGPPQPPDIGGQNGPSISPATWYEQGEPTNSFTDPSSADPFDENFNQNNVMAQQDSISQAESGSPYGEGDCGDQKDDGEGDGEDDDSSWYEEFLDEWDAVMDMLFDPDIDDLSWMY